MPLVPSVQLDALHVITPSTESRAMTVLATELVSVELDSPPNPISVAFKVTVTQIPSVASANRTWLSVFSVKPQSTESLNSQNTCVSVMMDTMRMPTTSASPVEPDVPSAATPPSVTLVSPKPSTTITEPATVLKELSSPSQPTTSDIVTHVFNIVMSASIL